MQSTYIPMPGESSSAPADAASVIDHANRAMHRYASSPAGIKRGLRADSHGASGNVREMLLRDFWLGQVQHAKAAGIRADANDPAWQAAGMRYELNSGLRADSANSALSALNYQGVPIVRRQFYARALYDGLPKLVVPAWAETWNLNVTNYGGNAAWQGGADTKAPISDYSVDSRVRPIEMVWTAYRTPVRQTMQAESPFYGLSPQAEKQHAAEETLRAALENANANGGVGSNLWGLAQAPMTRSHSPLTFGSSNVQDCFADVIRFIQSVTELSGFAYKPNALAWSPRIRNRMLQAITTSNGYPFDPATVLARELEAYGITQVIEAPSLQDFEGVQYQDAMVVYIDDTYSGLYQVEALAPTPIRTVQEGLSDVTYMIALHGGIGTGIPQATNLRTVTVTPIGA